MARNVKRLDRIDHKIIFVLFSLIIYGLVMIFSIASAKNTMGVFMKQVACMGAGFMMMYLFHFAHVGILRRLTVLIYPFAYVAILFLLLPKPYTVTANGAKRWINVGGIFSFQVAEYVKLAVILMLALWVDMCKNREDSIKGELIFIFAGWFIGAIPAGLLYKISNDLSSAAVILGITFIITFVSSKNATSIVLHLVIIVLAVVGIIMIVRGISHHMPSEAQIEAGDIQFRTARIAAWLAPEKYAKTVGFQPLHCLYAIANGGWFGKGLGQSWQKSILPMSDNDVIFAIIIEELGIFGGLVLLFLFALLVTLMCNVAYNIKDTYNRIIILGVVGHIVLQVLIHCGVCTNTIPNTGIGLPFISSGMTAGLFQLFEMAMVLSITRRYLLEIENKSGIDFFKFLPFGKNKKTKKKKKDAKAENVAAAESNVGKTENSPSKANGPIGGGRNYPRSYREKYGDRLYDRGRQRSARPIGGASSYGVANRNGRTSNPVGERRRYSNRREDYHNNLRQTRNGEYRGRDNFVGRSSSTSSRNNFSGRSSSTGSRNNFNNRSGSTYSRNNFSNRSSSMNSRNWDNFNSRSNRSNNTRNITRFDPNHKNR